MGLFNRIIRKFVKFFSSLQEEDVGKSIPAVPPVKKSMEPVEESLDKELSTAAKEFVDRQNKDAAKELEKLDLSQWVLNTCSYLIVQFQRLTFFFGMPW